MPLNVAHSRGELVSRGVGLVQLDIAAPRAGPAQRVIWLEFGRIDGAPRYAEPNGEAVIDTRLAVVDHPDAKIHLTWRYRKRGAGLSAWDPFRRLRFRR